MALANATVCGKTIFIKNKTSRIHAAHGAWSTGVTFFLFRFVSFRSVFSFLFLNRFRPFLLLSLLFFHLQRSKRLFKQFSLHFYYRCCYCACDCPIYIFLPSVSFGAVRMFFVVLFVVFTANAPHLNQF